MIAATIVTSTAFDGLIKFFANKRVPNLHWWQIKAQLWQESRLNPDAVSPVGAKGIAQFMDPTWGQIRTEQGYAPDTSPFDVGPALDGACAYMASLMGVWSSKRSDQERWYLALASYNAGIGDVLMAQKHAGGALDYASIIAQLPNVTSFEDAAQTRDYVTKIQGFYNELQAAA